jgi:hypothetical protein
MKKLLEVECCRVEQESHRVEANTGDDSTPRIWFMQWLQTFHRKDLKVENNFHVIANNGIR